MNDSIIPYALLCFTSFFTLINPLGTMPVFLSMTIGMTEAERKKIIIKATFVSALIMISFTIFGQYLFQVFGLSTNGFRIAGGIIIMKVGYDMLQAHYTHVKLNEEERKTYVDDISITPLAIPMLCGPGAIANGIVLMEDAETLFKKVLLISIILFVFLLTGCILRASTRLVKWMGDTGNNVMMRLMGLILMVLAVECFVSGAKPIMIDIIQQASVG